MTLVLHTDVAAHHAKLARCIALAASGKLPRAAKPLDAPKAVWTVESAACHAEWGLVHARSSLAGESRFISPKMICSEREASRWQASPERYSLKEYAWMFLGRSCDGRWVAWGRRRFAWNS